ncbi:MAG: nucleotidyltransferase family protein [Candidatus Micrarchaeaceae archaeon]
MEALILAGGKGKRLQPLTSEKPKPMLDVGGKPIIEWQIEWMKGHGVDSFIISAGYMKEKLIEYLGTGSRLGVDLSFKIEDEPLGTGGAIKNAADMLNDQDMFIVANGDIITNINLKKLVDSVKSVSTISLVPLRSTFGIVDTDGQKVVRFRSSPYIEDYWLNAGIYVMSKKVFDYLPESGSLEDITFPKLIDEGLLSCEKFKDVYWRSIDSFKDYDEVNKDLFDNVVYNVK